jgi:hypothetical protein
MSATTPVARSATLRGIQHAYRALLYVAFALAVGGCVPIGVRVQNMFA